jgi:hypothetical protein
MQKKAGSEREQRNMVASCRKDDVCEARRSSGVATQRGSHNQAGADQRPDYRN